MADIRVGHSIAKSVVCTDILGSYVRVDTSSRPSIVHAKISVMALTL